MLGSASHPNATDPLGGLSAREREVLQMASRGLTNSEISVQLNVTVHAVKFHLASIYRKLGLANRTEAAVFYLRASSVSAGLEVDEAMG